MDNKKNILWINYVKAFAILSVFLIHCNNNYLHTSGALNLLIEPYYVNAFFFVSGYLFFRKQLSIPIIESSSRQYLAGDGKRLVLNIFYRIMLPTILFSVIEYLPSRLLRGMGINTSDFLYKTLGGCTYWFTAALAVAELLLFLLLLSRQRNIMLYFLFCCFAALLGYVMVSYNFTFFSAYPSFPWQYQQGLYALLFMGFGGLFWKYEASITKWINSKVLIGLLVLYIVLVLLYSDKFKVLISVLDINIPGICISLLSILILIEICKRIPSIKILDFIGKNTIGFYFMSGALPIVGAIIAFKFSPIPSLLGWAILSGVSICSAYAIVYVLNRFAPWVFDLRKCRKREEL